MANDRRVILALGSLTCWLALASSAAAQGVLYGVVSYPTGRVAANVTVVAEQEDTGETWDARTSSLGLYEFYRLPIGTYTVRVNLSQLSFLAAGIKVRPRIRTALDIPLCVCREEVVTVRGSSALPRRFSDGSLGAAFSREAIEAMPKSNGENLQSVLIGIPGINFTETVGTLAQYTAIGQRRHSNRLTIDGVSADLAIDVAALGLSQAGSGTLPAFAITGGTQTLFSMSAAEEFQIRTTNVSSEHARSPGAQTVVVTRSGTDQFKASTETEIRPDSLAARNWFENAGKRPEARRGLWDTNVSLGGPILPRRVFYFGTWERQQADRSVFTTVNVPSLSLREALARRLGGAAFATFINSYPLPNGRESLGGIAELTGHFPVISLSNTFGVRLDATLSNLHRVFVRFHRGTSAGDALGSSYVPSYSFSTTESTETETTTVGLSSAWRRVTHDLRANVATHRGSVIAGPARLSGVEPLPYAQFVAPGVTKNDAWISFSLPFDGGLLQSGRYISNSQEQLHLVDNWSFVVGRHEWRFGLEYQQVTASIDPARHRYTYRFNTTDEIAQGLVRFTILQNLNPASARRESWALFATDTFRVSPRLTLNYGLRYSVKHAPFSRTELTPYLVNFNSLTPNELPTPEDGPLWNTSWKDLAPRVAASYQVGAITGWENVIRAGASLIFDDRSSSGMGVFGNGYGYSSSRAFLNSPFPVPASNLSIGTPPAPFSSADLSGYYSFPRDLRTPRTYEWHIGTDQSLGRAQQLSLAYVGGAGRDLIYWHTYDVGLPLVQAYSNDARSDYRALLVEYARRRSQGFQGSVAYTLSHAIDNDSGEARRGYAPPELISPSLNRGSADFDRRHVLRMAGSYQVPALRSPGWLLWASEDWQVGAVLTVHTGTPVSITYSKIFDFGTYVVRPDSVEGAPVWIVDSSSPGGWRINPNAFVEPLEARPGTLGRNTLRALPLRQVDAFLSRSVRFGQRLVAQLRFDAFNLFNIPNFGPPSGFFPSEGFGVPDRSYAESLGTGTLQNGGLMPIQQLGGSRSLQLGVRLSY